jgi:hypothetical protein
MTLDHNRLGEFLLSDPQQAWDQVFGELWTSMSSEIEGDAASEVVRRDKEVEGLDLLLSSAAWDLWSSFEDCAPKTSNALIEFWDTAPGSKAVLILDALSLRETPWLLEQASKRGYNIHRAVPTASALPSDTTSFARQLGLQQRASIEKGEIGSLKLTGAAAVLFKQHWIECADTLPNSPNLLVWHEWPDSIMHELSGPGPGLHQLAEDVRAVLTSDDFWKFIDRLTQGRRLVITGDHGYAASGQFSDVHDAQQKEYFQKLYGAERFAASTDQSTSNWLPPVDLALTTSRGNYRFTLGRRAWSVQGGRKNLSHGGISLLEVAVPFIELSKAL